MSEPTVPVEVKVVDAMEVVEVVVVVVVVVVTSRGSYGAGVSWTHAMVLDSHDHESSFRRFSVSTRLRYLQIILLVLEVNI